MASTAIESEVTAPTTDLSAGTDRATGQVQADRVAVSVDPADAAAWARLSRHARRTRDVELFIEASLGWAATAPDDPVIGHFAGIARSLQQGTTHERCSPGYVRHVFDHYADGFEDHLDHLGYRGPQLVAGLVHDLVADGDLPADATIADLGCGTGLVGHHLRAANRRPTDRGATDRDTTDRNASAPIEKAPKRDVGRPEWHGHLTGTDLSPRMLTHSAQRQVGGHIVYDEVVDADFTAFLSGRPARFHAVVAVDAFIYLGDLRPVLHAAATALRPGGWLVITLEHADDGTAARHGYAADLTGRYRHDVDWVHSELTAAGFGLAIVEDASIRHEHHLPVPGLVAVAQR